MKTTIEKIEDLYKQIPKFKCKPGCTACCGPIVWTKSEWARMKDKRTFTDINCPYAVDGKCECYQNRPFICRIFGVSEEKMLSCPHVKFPGKKLTKLRTEKLFKAYAELLEAE